MAKKWIKNHEKTRFFREKTVIFTKIRKITKMRILDLWCTHFVPWCTMVHHEKP
jgi:hypothetical protein